MLKTEIVLKSFYKFEYIIAKFYCYEEDYSFLYPFIYGFN